MIVGGRERTQGSIARPLVRLAAIDSLARILGYGLDRFLDGCSLLQPPVSGLKGHEQDIPGRARP
jgi:hypothetical protein